MNQKFFTQQEHQFMQKIFRFDLSKEEDQRALTMFEQAAENYHAINEALDLINKKIQYEDLTENEIKHLQEIRTTILDARSK